MTLSIHFAPFGLIEPVRYLLDSIFVRAYTWHVWEVEYTDQFGEWWDELPADQQKQVAASIHLLAERGPGLARPAVDTVTSTSG
jgi:hypothetical protein